MLTKSSLLAILATSPASSWTSRTVEGSGTHVRWMGLVRIGSHHFGITDEGDWCGEYADQTRVMPTDVRHCFLPLLERSHHEAVRLLRTSIAEHNLPDVVATSFPLDSLIECALQSNAHWQALAIAWIEDTYPLNDSIAELIPDHPTVRARAAKRERAVFPEA